MTEDSLLAAIRAMHARGSVESLERFPRKAPWEPAKDTLGTEKAKHNQSPTAAVPIVPTVPTEKQVRDLTSGAMTATEAWCEWESHVARLLWGGYGLDRAAAEDAATAALGHRPLRSYLADMLAVADAVGRGHGSRPNTRTSARASLPVALAGGG